MDLRVKALQQIDWDELEFDDVIIDEAQDFDNREILYFKDLVELKDGHFFVFYDKNQDSVKIASTSEAQKFTYPLEKTPYIIEKDGYYYTPIRDLFEIYDLVDKEIKLS